MSAGRGAITYFSLVISVIAWGLSVRSLSSYLPKWVNLYVGDILWALMVFFLFGLLFRNINTKCVAALALLFSFSIESSQLYHSPWIDLLRETIIGGLILGHGFLWSDLVSYTLGIGIGILLEKFILWHRKV